METPRFLSALFLSKTLMPGRRHQDRTFSKIILTNGDRPLIKSGEIVNHARLMSNLRK